MVAHSKGGVYGAQQTLRFTLGCRMKCMDETPDFPQTLPSVTYLREVAIEGQELHGELRYAGFTEKQATAIVAQMIADAVNSRHEEDFTVVYMESDEDDYDDEDDDYDDGDSGQ